MSDEPEADDGDEEVARDGAGAAGDAEDAASVDAEAEAPKAEPTDGADEASEHADETEAEERVPLSALRERLEAEQVGAGDISEGAPLSELARESRATTESERSELFEEVDVGDIDAEAVWDAIVEEGMPPEEALGAVSEAEPAEPTGTPDEHVIDKREYCQRCEFFCEPPDVGCTNEGTEILELVDNDHFRVRNCPKVEASEEELSSVVEE